MKQAHGTYYSVSSARAGTAARVSCTISKRAAVRAVDRNKAKRQCRAAFREAVSSKVPPLMIRIKPPALKASYAALRHEAVALVGRLAQI